MLAALLYFILTLAILVTVHEFGHYWVARRCGVKVLRFSLGFGPVLWQRINRAGCEFVLSAIPLGGYIKMLDERESPVVGEECVMAFNRQSPRRRAAIVAAGPLANLLLAVLVYTLIFLFGVPGQRPVVGEVSPNSPAAQAGLNPGDTIASIDGYITETRDEVHLRLMRRVGESGLLRIDSRSSEGELDSLEVPLQRWLSGSERPDPYAALGFSFYQPPWLALIEAVETGGPAALAGVQAGDRLLSVDSQAVIDWPAAVEAIQQRPGQVVTLTLQRETLRYDTVVRTDSLLLSDGRRVGRIGVRAAAPVLPPTLQVVSRSEFPQALWQGVERTSEMMQLTFSAIGKMLSGLISTSNLSGPVSIARMAASSVDTGVLRYMEFLALLSVSLAVLNLLPIPVLDGGHLLYISWEMLARQPLAEHWQLRGQQFGLLLILAIMLLALYNDVTQF